MHQSPSPEQEAFREEVRAWLDEVVPREPRPATAARRDYDLAWQRLQHDGGWAGAWWPRESGGRGLSVVEQIIWCEELGRQERRANDCCTAGLVIVGPALITGGTAEQREAHLAPILRGEVVWAVSERPGITAERTGTELALTGVLPVVPNADVADRMLLVTDDGTVVLVDLAVEGVSIRAVGSESGEVTLTGARTTDVLGDAATVLPRARALAGSRPLVVGCVQLGLGADALARLAAEQAGPDGRRPAAQHADVARRLASLRADSNALRALVWTMGDDRLVPAFAERLRRDLHVLAVEVLGVDALRRGPRGGRFWVQGYLASVGSPWT